MRRRLLSTLLCSVLLISGMLSGCGSQEAYSDNSASKHLDKKDLEIDIFDPATTITITGWLEDSYTQNLMAYLAEKYPDYTFEYKYIAKKSYESIIDSQLSSRLATDIVMVNPPMAKRHAQNGYIADLNDYSEGFNDEAKESFSYEGRMYAVPNTSEYQCTFYNKEIYKKVGRRLPNNFQEYLDYCDFLMDEKGIRSVSAGLKDSDAVADSALAFLASGFFTTKQGATFGERLEEGTTTFKSETMAQLTLWKELVNHGIYTKDMCITDKEAAIEEFASGKSFMYVGSVEDYNRIKEKNPDIKIGTTGFAGAVHGMPIIIGGCNCGFAVNNFCMNRDMAIEIVAELSKEEGQRVLWSDRIGSQTYLLGVNFSNPEDFDGIKAMVKAGRVFSPWNDWGKYGSQIYVIFGEELQKVVTGERTLNVALQVIDNKISQIRKDN